MRIFALGFGVMAVLLAWSNVASAGDPSPAVAKVNDREISRGLFMQKVAEVLPRSSFHGSVAPAKRAKIEAEVLDGMIVEELQWQEVQRRGVKPPDGEVKTAMEDAERKAGGAVALANGLRRAGRTVADLTAELARKAAIRTLLDADVNKHCTVDEKSVEKRYTEKKTDYTMPGQFRVSHILIKVAPSGNANEWNAAKLKVTEIAAAIAGGKAFAEMAREHSQDDFAARGGDLGWVHAGRLMPELETVVAVLKEGGVSTPTKTIYGWHLMRLEGTKPPKQLEFEQVKLNIRRTLEEECREARTKALVDGLRKTAKIEMLYRPGE